MTKIKEIWKDVFGYEGLYVVSNLGRVKALRKTKNNQWGAFISEERLLGVKPHKADGYMCTALTKDGVYRSVKIHRIVAEAFIGPSDGIRTVVNHKNGIKSDNRVLNLEWTTHSANIKHAYDTGLIKPTRGRQKLTKGELIEIKKLFLFGMTATKIAELYNMSFSAIMNTKKRTWKDLNTLYRY